MTRSKFLTAVALVSVLAIAGAACSKKGTNSGGNASSQACSQDQFGCIQVAKGAPFQLGTLLSIKGATAFLGTDSLHGVHDYAISYSNPTSPMVWIPHGTV